MCLWKVLWCTVSVFQRVLRTFLLLSKSQKSADRLSCGPGPPPLKQLRSYSVDTHPNSAHYNGRSRQRSVSGNVAVKKTQIRRVDEEALKRSRLHNSQYELSQDLLDKQVEMLERRYGGICARKAALTIQRAFRKYCIMKRFQDLANASKREKRLSRRLPTFDLESKEWMIYNGNSHGHNIFQNNQVPLSGVPYEQDKRDLPSGTTHSSAYMNAILKTNFAALYKELSDTFENENGPSFKPGRSQSFRERRQHYGDSKDVYGNGVYTVHPPHIQHTRSVDNDTGCQTSVVCRSPSSMTRLPNWSSLPEGDQRTSAINFISSPNSVTCIQEDHYNDARESFSSEDSAIGVMSGDGEILDDYEIQRGSCTRHSLTIPTSPAKQSGDVFQRTPARASDIALGRRVAPRNYHRKVPPQVPKRTSSISNREGTTQESGDVTPVQSQEDTKTSIKAYPIDVSPVWKRKSLVLIETQSSSQSEDKRLSNISENSEDSLEGTNYSSSPSTSESPQPYSCNSFSEANTRTSHETAHLYKMTEIQRKRQYRVGLNLFNKKPERGIRYLIQRGFLEAVPQAVARFLLTRKGLSKQMIGEYLGNLQCPFNMVVLECFSQELDLAGMQVDVALRKFQTFFRMPGEAQKIERLVEAFSRRYNDCNHDIVSNFHNPDTVFILAFAIIMLNTDLHTPNMKAEKRMKMEEFIKNLRGIDDGHNLDRNMLVGIYERIKTNEFKMGSDHVTQVMKVQQTIVGKKPNLALSHRRLVCYCRLYEVYDICKKERPGIHQREVFLFNDMIMVTKIFSKKKNSVSYTFRQSYPLCGMSVSLFEAPYYPHGIRLSQRVDDKVLVTFNARNEHDRCKFVDDLKESILEMDEMENLRIEGELEKQKVIRVRGTENRDSGVADMEIVPAPTKNGKLTPDTNSTNLKRSALSNSLLDLHEQQMNKPVRRGSAGSLDSGMSVSFQSSAASTVSHDSSPQMVHAGSTSSGGSGSSLGSMRSSTDSPGPTSNTLKPSNQQGFLGGLFNKKNKQTSKIISKKSLDTTDV